ncbi:MAG: hypothetical protein HOV83_16410 [Catenulispora sp.]|nr:hypothetical protein [Catenulispora sp.]
MADEVARLTLMATSAWLVPSPGNRDVAGAPAKDAVAGHGDLLRHLLESTEGGAWIRALPHAEDAADDSGGNGFVPGGDPRADALCADLQRGLTEAVRVSARAPKTEAVQDVVRTFRHRVFVDAARFAALARELDPGFVPHPEIRYVSFDFRLYQIRTRLRWHVSISIETHLPRVRGHRPDGLAADERLLTWSDKERWRFSGAARLAEKLVAGHLTHATFRVQDRNYLQADFWIVTPAVRPADLMNYPDDERGLVPRLSRSVLLGGGPREDAMSGAILNGQFLTLRRVSRKPSTSGLDYAPLYAIIPGVPRDDVGVGDDDEQKQESEAVRLVTKLADLEAYTGDMLDDVQHDLYVWQNHLDVYHFTATSGARLWDHLAAQLPIRRAQGLAQVHGSMELMHQVLLQGIADLAHLATLTQGLRARVSTSVADLDERYDDAITERPVTPGNSGIRGSLTETGLTHRLIRNVDEVAARAELVQATYDDMLEAITKAFDERRVREADALQRASSMFAIIIAVVGIVSVLGATLQMQGQLHWFAALTGHVVLAADLSIVIGLGLVVAAAYMGLRLVRLGRLGSRRFRALYRGRWSTSEGALAFLRDSSTEVLEELLGKPGTPWDAIDDDLAARLARTWDRANRHTDRRRVRLPLLAATWDVVRGQTEELHILARRIEKWCLHALLATERARRLYRYRLPRLTLLYRCVSRIPKSYFSRSDVTLAPEVNVVSFYELHRTLEESLQRTIPVDTVRAIDDRLTADDITSAEAALRLVRAEMTRLRPSAPGPRRPTVEGYAGPSPAPTMDS